MPLLTVSLRMMSFVFISRVIWICDLEVELDTTINELFGPNSGYNCPLVATAATNHADAMSTWYQEPI
jgi:hypothetical protein